MASPSDELGSVGVITAARDEKPVPLTDSDGKGGAQRGTPNLRQIFQGQGKLFAGLLPSEQCIHDLLSVRHFRNADHFVCKII